MKLTYFLNESTANCPVSELKEHRVVQWHDQKSNLTMYGPIKTVTGDKVLVGDGRFDTPYDHWVSRDEILQLTEAGRPDKVLWQREHRRGSPDIIELKQAVTEAAKHAMIGNKLTFKDDSEVEQVVLTKLDSHDIAHLICRVAVLEAFIEESKAHEKDETFRSSAEPEDLIHEKAHVLDTEVVSEKADSIAADIARSVKEYVAAMRRSDFNAIVWKYFPELK